uniref:Putative RNA-binding protein n=1 Tax=Trypanosoma congolense (strain IL3000) TaxID=1068625 RepID=G0UKB9_TRYCI|nr:putative RNA-binding protein [Trypanosoma congolense IL3000]
MELSEESEMHIMSLTERFLQFHNSQMGLDGIPVPASATERDVADHSMNPPLPLFGLADEVAEGKISLRNDSGPITSSSGSHCSSSNVLAGAGRGDVSAPVADSRAETRSRTNLFVSNIPRTMGKSGLTTLFEPYGEIVSAAVMRNIHTGESLGTAFVRFATTEQAQRAMEALTGSMQEGRAMIVQWAKRQHDDTPVGEARRKIVKLFVRNIPLDVSDGDLSELFGRFGAVKGVSIHKDTTPSEGRNAERRIAFITFQTESVAEKAAEVIHNTRPFPSCGKIPLMVKLAEDNPRYARGQHTSNGRGTRGRNANNSNDINGGMGNNHPLRTEGRAPARELCGIGGDATRGIPNVFSLGGKSCAFPGGAFAVFPAIIPQAGVFMPQSVMNVGIGSPALAMKTPMFWHQNTALPMGVMNQSQAAAVEAAHCSQRLFSSQMNVIPEHSTNVFPSFMQPFPESPAMGLAEGNGFPGAPAPTKGSEIAKDELLSSSDLHDADTSLSLDFLGSLNAVGLGQVVGSSTEENNPSAPGSFIPFL